MYTLCLIFDIGYIIYLYKLCVFKLNGYSSNE